MPDEVIVVDNNSNDKTVQVARDYNFVRVVSQPIQGVVHARDKGFDEARSDIIGRIDADTILPHDWVEEVIKFYDEPANGNHGLSGGAYFYNMRYGHTAGWWQGQVAFRVNRLLLGHYIFFGSNMAFPAIHWPNVKRRVCHDLDVHEDLDLAIHWHREGLPITYHETLKVGIKMRRVFSDRRELWHNLQWWPHTIKRHGRWTWMFGWLGAALLYLLSFGYFLVKK